MGMCLALHSVSDKNIEKILNQPELIWQLIAPDDPEIYQDAIQQIQQPGFLARLFGKKPPAPVEPQQLNLAEGEGVEDDLDKSWHGIHFCLNKTDYDAQPPMDFITVGGLSAGDIDVGYGPARLFHHDTVKTIHQHLSEISTEGLQANYDPQKMDELDIYPNIWKRDSDEGFEYIADYFDNLKTFVEKCVKNKLGMAVYLC
ncbi:YfbM family protein [bacterium SCSIO 12696]|nr:YfbM family protein [bacterium SCSIO 12696]